MKPENLYKFNNPSTFLNLVTSKDIFTNKKRAYREIWVASRFCYGLNKLRKKDYQVRLVQDNFPDFELKNGNKILSFETKEIIEKDRKRGDEYKNDPGWIKPMDFKEMSKRDYIAVIKNAVKDRIKSKLCATISFVFYVNILYGEFAENEIDNKDIEEIAGIFKKQQIPFDEIWLFWCGGQRTYFIARLYPDIEKIFEFGTNEGDEKLYINLNLPLRYD